MMLPTHTLVGLAIATPLLVVAPEFATWGLAGAVVGSVLPDLDMYAGHRRTLHYPTGYTIAAVPAGIAALLYPSTYLAATAFLLVGSALHCRMDRYGGGLELRPWKETSDRAVYDHVRGRWLSPKRWIPYDGAPADVLFSGVVGLPLLIVLDGPFRWVAAGAIVVGFTYGAIRRRLATLSVIVFENAPDSLAAYVPERYRSEDGHRSTS